MLLKLSLNRVNMPLKLRDKVMEWVKLLQVEQYTDCNKVHVQVAVINAVGS